jgi:hypothetical protein
MSTRPAPVELSNRDARLICEGVRKDPVAKGEAVELVKGRCVEAVGNHAVVLGAEIEPSPAHSVFNAELVPTVVAPSHCCRLLDVLRAA